MLGALQAQLLVLAQQVFDLNAPGAGLSGALLAGAALQLLPLCFATRASDLHPSTTFRFQLVRLVRLTCRVTVSMHSTPCLPAERGCVLVGKPAA